VTDGQLTVEDQDSKNGTRVDGRKLSELAVSSGQKITFGTFEATVLGGNAHAGSTMTAFEIRKPDNS
jgi:pSer/pThr/pTyr-binding forkhead associated (FHA) protein